MNENEIMTMLNINVENNDITYTEKLIDESTKDDNLLYGYSEEEIKAFAKAHLNDEKQKAEKTTFKIEQIEKEVKTEKKKAISRAVLNASVILLIAGSLMNADSTITNVLTDELSTLAERFSYLPIMEPTVAIFNQVIERFGAVGIILASKSTLLLARGIKDTKKIMKMNDELSTIKSGYNEAKEDSNVK